MAAASLVGSVARAEPDPHGEAAALALFEEGRKLVEAGRFAEACPKFADSEKLDPGAGTMLNLAYCYERIGKTASAWSAYHDAAAAARDKGEADRERVARAHAAELEATLAKITVVVGAQASDRLAIMLDGATLPRTLWGVPTPVDPGSHLVEARVDGRAVWSASVDASAERSPVVDIPSLEGPLAPTTAPDHAAELSAETPPSTGPSRATGLHPLRVTSLVLGSAGVATLVVGGVMTGFAKSRYDDSTDPSRCNAANHCTAAGAVDRNDAFRDADIATGAVVAGGVLLAAAVVLWVTSPRSLPAGGRLVVAPMVGRAASGLSLEGTW